MSTDYSVNIELSWACAKSVLNLCHACAVFVMYITYRYITY